MPILILHKHYLLLKIDEDDIAAKMHQRQVHKNQLYHQFLRQEQLQHHVTNSKGK